MRGRANLTLLIIGMVFAGGILLVNGPQPQLKNPPPGSEQVGQPVLEKTTDAYDALQLKTLKFQSCGSKLAVNFLIDKSGSMRQVNKMARLQQAVTAFMNKLSDTSVIGMQAFSDGVQDLLPLGYYKDNKTQAHAALHSLFPNGATYTRDGFLLAQSKLKDAISQNKFPGYKFALILMTDGIPEKLGTPPNQCLATVPDPLSGIRCFSLLEDPRTPTNVPQEIKNMGVQIFSIGIYSQSTSDKKLEPHLVKLLQDVASSPNAPYYQSTFNPDELQNILDQISTKVCDSA